MIKTTRRSEQAGHVTPFPGRYAPPPVPMVQAWLLRFSKKHRAVTTSRYGTIGPAQCGHCRARFLGSSQRGRPPMTWCAGLLLTGSCWTRAVNGFWSG